MYKLTIQNSDLQELNFNELNGSYNITNIQGLSPAEATINTSQAALLDGAFFNSSKVNMRTLNLAFTIEGRVEYNRLFVYRVLKVKEPVTIYYKSNNLDVFIKGYVKSITVGHFDAKQKATVQILCPNPYWKAAQEVIDELSVYKNMFYFPFASVAEGEIIFGEIDTEAEAVVINASGIETGLKFELFAKSPIANPKIFNYLTGDFIGLNFSMQAGDYITINTGRGEKSITLFRNGQTINIFNAIMENSTWLMLPSAGAVFVYTVESGALGNLEITISHYDLYEGV